MLSFQDGMGPVTVARLTMQGQVSISVCFASEQVFLLGKSGLDGLVLELLYSLVCTRERRVKILSIRVVG